MEGRWEGSLDQQRVIRLSMGLGKFLIKGGLVPESEKKKNKVIPHTESKEQMGVGITPDKPRNIANAC